MTIQKITTKDHEGNINGWIIPFYKKTDEIFTGYDLKFIYASAISANTKKGPHLHLKRECRLLLLTGKVVVTVRRDGHYEDFLLNSDNPEFFVIETGTAFCVENRENSQAIILNLANHIWTSDDQDTNIIYDWKPS